MSGTNFQHDGISNQSAVLTSALLSCSRTLNRCSQMAVTRFCVVQRTALMSCFCFTLCNFMKGPGKKEWQLSIWQPLARTYFPSGHDEAQLIN